MKRGQVSTETLAIMGFSAILLLTLAVYVFPKINNYHTYLEVSAAENSLTKLASSIKTAAAYGPGTQSEIELYFPKGQLEIKEKVLIYYMKDYEISIAQKIPENVQLEGVPTFEGGNYRFNIKYEDNLKVEVN